MRKIDENRARNYITKHERHKKWIVTALCISLLTGTSTLYMLNKPATAMTEDGAQSVGVVLDTADAEFEENLIQEMLEAKEDAEFEAAFGADDGEDNSSVGSSEGDDTEENSDAAEGSSMPSGSDAAESSSAINGSGAAEGSSAVKGSGSKGEAGVTGSSVSELTDETVGAELTEDSGEATEKKVIKKIIRKTSTKSAEDKDSEVETETKEDVVITVLYQDKDGVDIEEAKELSISESFNLKEEARQIDGYAFAKGYIGEDEIVSIVKKTADGTVKEADDATKDSSIESAEDAETAEVKEEIVYIDAETGEEISLEDVEAETDTEESDEESDDADKSDVKVVIEEEVVEDTVETKEAEDNEKVSEAADSEYTYYEATLLDGNILVIDENTDLRLVYTKLNEKEEFEYEAEGVKVTVKLSNPAVLPDGAELKVSTLDENTEGYNYQAYLDALNESAQEIADAKGSDEAVEYNSENVVLFDICFMYEDKEYQLEDGTAKVSIVFTDKSISDGLGASDSEGVTVVHLPITSQVIQEVDSTKDATEISAEDITVEVLTESTVSLEGESDEISFETTSFSMYGALNNSEDRTWEGSDSYSAQDIVKMFGDATYFGVVANTYDGKNNDSETNIAVGKISNVQEYTIGNSLQVYTHLTDYNITVNKEVIGPTKSGTFNFALFADADGKDKISGSEFTITTGSDGHGSYSMDVADYIKSHASLYVYELDSYGNAILDGKTAGSYTVSYESDSISGNSDAVSYFTDSYIEDLNGYRITDGDGQKGILRKIDGATIYYKLSDSAYVGVTYYNGAQNNEIVEVKDGAFPVSISGMRSDAENASVKLANAVSNDSVEVVNIIGTAKENYVGGNLESDLTKYYFKSASDAYAVNTGFVMDSNKLLLINVDLTGVDSYEYNKIKVNQHGTGDWDDIANQMVVNFVEKDANGNYVPYSGNLTANIASGLLVAPDADVTLQGSYAGTVIADNVYKECEIHKITVRRFLSENGTVNVTNVVDGSAASIHLNKYLNGENPGDHQFKFSVRALKHKADTSGNWWNRSTTNYYLETLTNELTNIGKDINYTFDYDANFIAYDDDGKSNPRIWLVITENDIDQSQNISKDNSYIIARIALNEDLKSVKNIYYFRYNADSQSDLISNIESGNSDSVKNAVISDITTASSNAIADAADVAFYNEGSGLLRIHKMVVNEYASNIIRNDPNAILQNVWFRVSNNSSGVYLAFKGFVGTAGTSQTWFDTAGKAHTITYNDGAQWTIEGLEAGTYTVQEMGDGFTFGYDIDNNSSYMINSYDRIGADVSRVTKYTVTEDDEENRYCYGVGGNNWRKLFSRDVSAVAKYQDEAPTNVKVGGKTQTVQVANYYSIPIGPIQFTKNFSGAQWTSDMEFTFKIEPVGCKAYTSEGEPVTLPEQPMPQKPNTTEIQNTVTITGADATYNEATGTYTAIAQFSSIPFKYKGVYVYKITETNTGIDGVKYDDRVYYVRFDVEHKYTRFEKKYSYKKNPHTIYVQQGNKNTIIVPDEDFYYLGANVTYATDPGCRNVVAYCELYLPDNPKTVDFEKNVFLMNWQKEVGDSTNVVFNNVKTGDLKVKKVWKDSTGAVIKKVADSSLPLTIWQKTENANAWTEYGAVVLSSANGWEASIPVPVTDGQGNRYVYTIKEPDKYLNTYVVTYTYNGTNYAGNEQQIITMNDESVRDTGYVMINGNSGFGEVVITNQALSTNTLPSTGGMGTAPFVALGALLIAVAFAGIMLFKKRRTL